MEAAEIHRIPQSKYVDAIRWVSPVSALDTLVAMAVHDFDSDESFIQIHSLLHNNKGATLNMVSSWCCPSRVSCLRRCDKNHKPLIAASTFEGSLHFLPLPLDSDLSLPPAAGPISAIDFLCDSTPQCVTVGEDGRVNLVTLGNDSRLHPRRVFDSQGLVSYTALKSASPTEFATGGFGFTLHWWDHRKPGGLASASAWDWAPKSGLVHSIDIHESRKHVCVVGGSLGTVFAWDLRWQKQPILLSGIGSDEIAAHSPFAREVWEVQYDCYKQSTNSCNMSSAQVLPVVFCSEDGLLAVVKHGEEPMEIVVEPCAINSLDINPQNASDVICSLEWETVALILRQ